ncbi:hypothetical protein [Georgenia sp. SUBG003]|uniref:hypothetical protein n=1 Tax=Georgenia sp. SUBG003 TaxID=1497974 RepID=UPI0004D38D7D|nr:hypothetical protein DA06_07300 [Georgenia sp. SUBG003]
MPMPSRIAHRAGRSPRRWNASSSAASSVAVQSTVTVMPMTENRAPSTGVLVLKWLILPRTTCVSRTTISTADATAMTVPAHHSSRDARGRRDMSHAHVTP